MSFFRVNAQVSWQFETNVSYEMAIEIAKKQLDYIIDTSPHGEDYGNFSIQLDVAKMKNRKKLVHVAEFSPDEIFQHISTDEIRREYKVKDRSYFVRMNSLRYLLFKDNPNCVSCGIKGTKMILDINPGDQNPHFNLYGEELGRLVLITKDHITPKGLNGCDELLNFQTMCSICNNLKGCCHLTLEQISELRNIYKNENKLSKKELRELINKKKEKMCGTKG